MLKMMLCLIPFLLACEMNSPAKYPEFVAAHTAGGSR